MQVEDIETETIVSVDSFYFTGDGDYEGRDRHNVSSLTIFYSC